MPDAVTPLPLADLPRTGGAEETELARTVLGALAERARAEAHAQGYAVGWARGRREAAAAAAEERAAAQAAAAEAEHRREDEHRAAVAALRSAADQVRDLLTAVCESIEEQGTDLALALVETLLARELTTVTDADVVRRVLAVAPAAGATVRLHPSVAAALTGTGGGADATADSAVDSRGASPADSAADSAVDSAADSRCASPVGLAGLTIVADPALGRADALVILDGTVTDLRIDTAMERVREALS
jgi:flagellar assembly protein FliH